MTCLLDVNVLIALIDPAHLHHDLAHDWFAAEGAQAWATCPLTENGVLRVLGNPRYPNSPGTPAAIAGLIARLRAVRGHAFWPDDISLLDSTLVDPARLTAPARITDIYLLALARSHDGRLATFDRRIDAGAVKGGARSLCVIG